MTDYIPDAWIILRFESEEHGIVYKVLGGWGGGYLSGDGWRLSSGIKKVEWIPDDTNVGHKTYVIHNDSGSRYFCKETRYGLRMSNAWKYEEIKKKLGDAVTGYQQHNTLWNILDHDWTK